MANLEDHGHYLVLLPILAAVLCSIRYMVIFNYELEPPKNESEAMRLIESLLKLIDGHGTFSLIMHTNNR